MKRYAVIGGGWAGLSAAVTLVRAGHHVSLYEAARHPGGRARSVEWQTGDGRRLMIDNGQHILLGAYHQTQEVMESIGIAPHSVFHRLPMRLETHGSAKFRLGMPQLPPPFHLFGALVAARGLSWADRAAAIRLGRSLKRDGWRARPDQTVAEWLDAHGQTPRLRKYVWEPLGIAALNTPPQIASAEIFLNVLRDSLGAARSDSEMLIPKVDLGSVFPEPAVRFISERGATYLGRRVTGLMPSEDGIQIFLDHNRRSEDVPGIPHGSFDGAVLAVSAEHVPPILQNAEEQHRTFSAPIRRCRGLSWQPIMTIYLLYAKSPFPPGTPPVLMLEQDAATGNYSTLR